MSYLFDGTKGERYYEEKLKRELGVNYEKVMVDAYNKLLLSLLDYMQSEKLINHKQRDVIMKYCNQNDSEKISSKKISKILEKVYKKDEEKNVKVPEYDELKRSNRLKFNYNDYAVNGAIDFILQGRSKIGANRDIGWYLNSMISHTKEDNEKLLKKNRSKDNTSRQITIKSIREAIRRKFEREER